MRSLVALRAGLGAEGGLHLHFGAIEIFRIIRGAGVLRLQISFWQC